MKSFPSYFMGGNTMSFAPLENLVGLYPSIFARKCRIKLLNIEFGKKDCKTKQVSEFMHYIRIGMFSVKTPQGIPLTLITSSLAIKQQWLTLDHWVFLFNNSPKDSGGFKKQQVKKHSMKLQKKNYGHFLWLGFKCFQTRATLRRQFTLQQ